MEPLSANLTPVLEWIRRETPSNAVFVASRDYAPSIAALGGRRVLRVPTLATAKDGERRHRAERLLLTGKSWARLAEDYGLRYVFVAVGDFREYGLRAPEDLASRAGFRLRYADPEGFRIYELNPREAPAAEAAPDSGPTIAK